MLVFFLFGLIIGSFLNVCIYRIPQNQSIAFPASRCSHCKTPLAVRDLIPVVSYLFLKGRCRYCHHSISKRYPLVELLTAFLFVLCYMVTGYHFESLGLILFTSFLLVITFIDIDHHLIFDKVLTWFALMGIAFNALHTYENLSGILPLLSFLDMLTGVLIGGGSFLAIALISKGGMGGGDIKLAAALGLWLGWKLNLLALFLAFLFGGIGSGTLLALKIKGRKDPIPFGPFISAGAFISMLYGSVIIDWYLQVLNR